MLLKVSIMNNSKQYIVCKLTSTCRCQLLYGLPFRTLRISAEGTSCYISSRVVYFASSIDAASVFS